MVTRMKIEFSLRLRTRLDSGAPAGGENAAAIYPQLPRALELDYLELVLYSSLGI